MAMPPEEDLPFRAKLVLGIFPIVTLGLAAFVLVNLIIYYNNQFFPEALQMASQIDIRISGAAMFFAVALSRAFRAFLLRGEGTPAILPHILYIVVSLAGAVVLPAAGGSSSAWQFAGAIYMAAAVAGRVLSFIRTRKKRNIAAAVLLAGVTALFWIVAGVVAVTAIITQSMAEVFALSFSRLRIDILKKIIRKTYASEILFGLALLIATFSLILPLFETDIPDFGNALWYCFAIVTTIGFGDFTAKTLVGRILSVFLGMYGIVVVALITSIIVNFYGEMQHAKEDSGEAEK